MTRVVILLPRDPFEISLSLPPPTPAARPSPPPPNLQAADAYAALIADSARSAFERTADLLLAASEGSAALADVTAEATAAAAASARDTHYEAQLRVREAVWVRKPPRALAG